MSVTVFGRYIDFVEQVKASVPDAILTKPDVIRQFGSYSLRMSGLRHGSSDEPYVLVSEKKKTREKQQGNLTIGAVDFLGRHAMDSLVQSIVPMPARTNRVSKIEDLLPLLTFGMADAVLVSSTDADFLARTSNIELQRSEITGRKIGIIGLGIKKEGGADAAVRAIKELSKETKLLFDIEEWR
jgi:hypothetical protein